MIHCAITTHHTPEPAVAYATIDDVCLPRCQMHIARARRDGCTVRLRPLTPEPETVTVTRAVHPTDPPEPTMPDTTPPVDPDLRARRSEAARKGRITRERNALARAGGVVAPVVEQAAPAEPVTLIRDGTAYMWQSGRMAIAVRLTGEFLAWADAEDAPYTPHPTLEAAAAHLGAVLPGEDARVVLSPVSDDPGQFVWPSGQIALTRTTGDGCIVWRKGETVGKTYDHVTDALIALGARLPDAPGDGEVGAPRVGRSEPPAWRDPFPPGGPTPRERELQTQVEAQAAELADINAILDTTGSAPGQTTPERVRALADYAVETGESVLRAHEALDAAGIPTGGQPADRIRILAERRADPLTPQIRGIVAQILAGMEDRTSGTDGLGIAYDIRALRLAVGIES